MLLNNQLHTKAKNAIGGFLSKRKLASLNIPKFPVPGTVQIDNVSFQYHDARCFYDTYKEIFIRKMYAFNTNSKQPYILDCGANMGVSVLFFAKKFPNAIIHAFEPEPEIFTILEKNVQNFALQNVTLHKKAVWINEKPLQFFTDKGMGGSVTNVYKDQAPTIIETVNLANFMQQKVDLLKMDIEGAEFEVLLHVKDCLKNVENIFVEYHSFINKPQELQTILQLLKDNGFRYHLSQSFSYTQPFIDNSLACENMDLAINIFGYRNK
jgi:FkbM family methyltransferase